MVKNYIKNIGCSLMEENQNDVLEDHVDYTRQVIECELLMGKNFRFCFWPLPLSRSSSNFKGSHSTTHKQECNFLSSEDLCVQYLFRLNLVYYLVYILQSFESFMLTIFLQATHIVVFQFFYSIVFSFALAFGPFSLTHLKF